MTGSSRCASSARGERLEAVGVTLDEKDGGGKGQASRRGVAAIAGPGGAVEGEGAPFPADDDPVVAEELVPRGRQEPRQCGFAGAEGPAKKIPCRVPPLPPRARIAPSAGEGSDQEDLILRVVEGARHRRRLGRGRGAPGDAGHARRGATRQDLQLPAGRRPRGVSRSRTRSDPSRSQSTQESPASSTARSPARGRPALRRRRPRSDRPRARCRASGRGGSADPLRGAAGTGGNARRSGRRRCGTQGVPVAEPFGHGTGLAGQEPFCRQPPMWQPGPGLRLVAGPLLHPTAITSSAENSITVSSGFS